MDIVIGRKLGSEGVLKNLIYVCKSLLTKNDFKRYLTAENVL